MSRRAYRCHCAGPASSSPLAAGDCHARSAAAHPTLLPLRSFLPLLPPAVGLKADAKRPAVGRCKARLRPNACAHRHDALGAPRSLTDSLAAVSEGVITEVSIPTTVDWVQRLPDLAVPMLRGAVGALLSALLCAMPDSAAVRERAS